MIDKMTRGEAKNELHLVAPSRLLRAASANSSSSLKDKVISKGGQENRIA